MTKNQRNVLILVGILMIVFLAGIAGSIDYNRRLQVSRDAFAAGLAQQEQNVNATITAIFTH